MTIVTGDLGARINLFGTWYSGGSPFRERDFPPLLGLVRKRNYFNKASSLFRAIK